jgi:hypothetical protein
MGKIAEHEGAQETVFAEQEEILLVEGVDY